MYSSSTVIKLSAINILESKLTLRKSKSLKVYYLKRLIKKHHQSLLLMLIQAIKFHYTYDKVEQKGIITTNVNPIILTKHIRISS